MTDNDYIDKTLKFIKEKFKSESSGHDYWHMIRVWQNAKRIIKDEPIENPLIVELSALLHDIADFKFNDGDMEAGPKAARQWLESINVSEDVIIQVEDIIRTSSFKGANDNSRMKTIEGKIIYDADKLDGIGAIGVARVFAYGGFKSREIYNPEIKPTEHKTFEEYKNNNSPSINHFYEKLLLLKDRMQTNTGKKLAIHRHEYLIDFLSEFYDEWDGKK